MSILRPRPRSGDRRPPSRRRTITARHGHFFRAQPRKKPSELIDQNLLHLRQVFGSKLDERKITPSPTRWRYLAVTFVRRCPVRQGLIFKVQRTHDAAIGYRMLTLTQIESAATNAIAGLWSSVSALLLHAAVGWRWNLASIYRVPLPLNRLSSDDRASPSRRAYRTLSKFNTHPRIPLVTFS